MIELSPKQALVEDIKVAIHSDTCRFPPVSRRPMLDRPPFGCMADLLKGSFIIGENHSHVAPKKFLIENMSQLKRSGFGTIFLEHLYYDDQHLLDDYCDIHTHVEDMPKRLSDRLINIGFNHCPRSRSVSRDKIPLCGENNLIAVVRAAKQTGIRIIALDTKYVYTKQGCSTMTPGRDYKIRNKAFNYCAICILEAELRKYRGPTHKYCALVGNTHVHSVGMDIPGIADAMGIKSLFIQDQPIRKGIFGFIRPATEISTDYQLDVSSIEMGGSSVQADLGITMDYRSSALCINSRTPFQTRFPDPLVRSWAGRQ